MNKFNTSTRNSQPVYASGRVVGYVRKGTFFKTIAANHYLRKPPAIAFSVDSLDQAEQAGAVWVQVKDRETGVIYRATIEHIRSRGFAVNRGFEPQIALSLDGGWIVQRKGAPVQLDLFGGAK